MEDSVYNPKAISNFLVREAARSLWKQVLSNHYLSILQRFNLYSIAAPPSTILHTFMRKAYKAAIVFSQILLEINVTQVNIPACNSTLLANYINTSHVDSLEELSETLCYLSDPEIIDLVAKIRDFTFGKVIHLLSPQKSHL